MPGLRDWWARLGRHAEPETTHVRRPELATDRIADCVDRRPVRLRGRIDRLVVQPREQTANWLEALMGDGSGTVRLIWMGRHEIPGIEAGREIGVYGRVLFVDGEPRIYNPYYTLY